MQKHEIQFLKTDIVLCFTFDMWPSISSGARVWAVCFCRLIQGKFWCLPFSRMLVVCRHQLIYNVVGVAFSVIKFFSFQLPRSTTSSSYSPWNHRLTQTNWLADRSLWSIPPGLGMDGELLVRPTLQWRLGLKAETLGFWWDWDFLIPVSQPPVYAVICLAFSSCQQSPYTTAIKSSKQIQKYEFTKTSSFVPINNQSSCCWELSFLHCQLFNFSPVRCSSPVLCSHTEGHETLAGTMVKMLVKVLTAIDRNA